MPRNEITTDIVSFERRMNADWSSPDSVYDAFLVVNDQPRNWFPLKVFEAELPDFRDHMEKKLFYCNIFTVK